MTNPTRVLIYTCGASVALYVLLVGCTVYFAAEETRLMSLMRNTESAVSALEEEYYGAIAAVSSKDPYHIGFAAPVRVLYVTSGAEALSLGTTDVKP